MAPEHHLSDGAGGAPVRPLPACLSELLRPELAMSLLPVERVVIHALLRALRPRLAIEIGSERGGSSRLIASYAARLICIDIDPGVCVRLEDCANIEVITGDSARELPVLLARLAEAGERVDFCFVDGDHSYEGVLADLSALLASPALACALILVHDCAMAGARRALRAAAAAARVEVAFYDPDFSAGVAIRSGARLGRAGGLGLVITGAAPGLEAFLRGEHQFVALIDVCERLAPRGAGFLLRTWRRILPKRWRDRLYALRRRLRR